MCVCGDAGAGINIAVCFVVGAALSAGAGWLGMMVATDANVKTTEARSAAARHATKRTRRARRDSS